MRLKFLHVGSTLALTFSLIFWTFASTVSNAAAGDKASTSRRVRDQSIREIPYGQLTPEARNRIASVVNRPSMYRRMPTSEIECDEDMYRLLIRNPEIVVNVWQLMGITKVAAQRIAPFQLDTSDGIGTTSRVELVYGTKDTHLFYCDGNYDGPLFRKPLKGKCVLLLKNNFTDQNGATKVVSRLDVFLQLEHVGADVLTRTLHPLVGKSADINFIESMKFLQRISQTAEKNGPGMELLAGRLDQVDEPTRVKFAEVSAKVFQQNRQRLALQSQRQKN